MRKKCPYSEFFWSAFSRIRTKKTPNTDTFYAVLNRPKCKGPKNLVYCVYLRNLLKTKNLTGEFLVYTLPHLISLFSSILLQLPLLLLFIIVIFSIGKNGIFLITIMNFTPSWIYEFYLISCCYITDVVFCFTFYSVLMLLT